MSIKAKLITVMVLICSVLGMIAGLVIYSSIQSSRQLRIAGAKLGQMEAMHNLSFAINNQLKDFGYFLLTSPKHNPDSIKQLKTNADKLFEAWIVSLEAEGNQECLQKAGIIRNEYEHTLRLIIRMNELQEAGKTEEALEFLENEVEPYTEQVLITDVNEAVRFETGEIEDVYHSMLLSLGLVPWIAKESKIQVDTAQAAIRYLTNVEKSRSNLARQTKEALDYLISGKSKDLKEFELCAANTESALDDWTKAIETQIRLEYDVEGEKEDLVIAGNVKRQYDRVLVLFKTAFELKMNRQDAEALAFFKAEVEPLLNDNLFPLIEKTIKDGNVEVLDAHGKLLRFAASARMQGLFVVGIAFLFIVFASFELRGMISSLNLIRKGTQVFGQGRLDHRIGLKSNDELGRLAFSLDSMASDLQKSREEILSAKEYTENILRSMNDALIVVSPDRRIKTVNSAACALLGYKDSELIGELVEMVFMGETPLLESLDIVALEQPSGRNVESTLRSKDGRPIPVTIVTSIMRDKNGHVEGLVIAAQDITERKRVQEALSESEAKFRALTESAASAIIIYQEGRFYYTNPATSAITGYTAEELRVMRLDELIHPDFKELLKGTFSLQESKGSPLRFEFKIITKTGYERWIDCTAMFIEFRGKPAVLGTAFEITERKIAEERLLHDTLHDTLTGLPNRNLFMERLRHALERAKRHKDYGFAVLFMDLDRFKSINDFLGHLVGDQLLIKVSRGLESCLRATDTAARLGGDEFVVLIDDVKEPSDPIRVVEKIQKKLAPPFYLNGQEVFTTVSIGIALGNDSYERPEHLLRDADTALYRAKALGKGRYQIFDSNMHAQVMSLLRLEADLHRAVERNEFEVFYEPIVSLSDGKITSVEALLRWRHPERGLLLPKDFLSVAEETGLIIPIGEWMLRKACAQTKEWHDNGYPELHLLVNFTGRQLKDRNMLDMVMNILDETGMPANRLNIEITEGTAGEDTDVVGDILNRLKAIGIGVSLDDFGAYQKIMMGYFDTILVNSVKIDYSLIKDILTYPGCDTIIKAIIEMTHVKQRKVIAEGVETREQRDVLHSLKCDEMQGYLLSPAMRAEEFSAFLLKQNCAV
ncbi:MAG: EAL domain-containing protein [Bacillota bacterium]